MSRTAKVRLVFGDGPRNFRLGIGEIDELEEITGYGLKRLFMRIRDGDHRASELRNTLRLGLIGGGMKPAAAWTLVDRYAKEGYLVDCEEPATLILGAALTGSVDDAMEGEPEGELTGERTASPSPTAV